MAVRLRGVDVAREFSRSSAWLKDLERKGVIPPAPRDHAGYRFYTLADVDRIRSIIAQRRTRRVEDVPA